MSLFLLGYVGLFVFIIIFCLFTLLSWKEDELYLIFLQTSDVFFIYVSVTSLAQGNRCPLKYIDEICLIKRKKYLFPMTLIYLKYVSRL